MADLKTELRALLENMGITDEWRLDDIKETAMNRHKVKKSRRPHIKAILDEAFVLLREQPND